MNQNHRDYSWAAYLDSMEGGLCTVRLPAARGFAWPAGKHDDSWTASLDCMEGGWWQGSHSPSAPPAGLCGWLARNRQRLTKGVLLMSTFVLVGLWLARHGFWPFTDTVPPSAGLTLSCALVMSLAGFTQGLAGFGFGFVAIALLPLLMNLKQAVAAATLLNLIVCIRTFLSVRAHYSWRKGLGLVVGAGLGVPIGTWVLVQLNEALLLRLLGSVMLAFSASELLLARAKPLRLSPRLGLPLGLVSGGLSGAFGVGGPPAIAFTYSQAWTKEQIVAVLQVVFGICALLRMLLLGNAGLLSPSLVRLGLWSVLPMIAAIALGQRFFSKIPQPVLRHATFLFLWTMGLKYLLFP